jgi:SP family general alpha glucoside:H+ symporter-like MFS transporter
LVGKNREAQAAKVLTRLKGNVPGYDVDVEVAVMRHTIDEQLKRAGSSQKIPYKKILWGLNGKRLVIALWPKLCQQFVGLSVFNNYATYFFQVAGNKDPFLVTVILACVQLMSMLGTMCVVDSWGRRPLAVYGYMITVGADFGMGAVGFYDVKGRPAMGSLLVFFACLATFATTSSSATGYAYLSEIPKQDFRAISAGWGLAIPNIFSIMVSLILICIDSRADLPVLLRHANFHQRQCWMGCQNWSFLRLYRICRRRHWILYHSRDGSSYACRD